MKLNPNKYVFDVTSRKFLGFMVTQQAIEANSKKIQALLDMKHLGTKKDMQCLAGRIASLSRFISRSVEKYLPFFKVLG